MGKGSQTGEFSAGETETMMPGKHSVWGVASALAIIAAARMLERAISSDGEPLPLCAGRLGETIDLA